MAGYATLKDKILAQVTVNILPTLAEVTMSELGGHTTRPAETTTGVLTPDQIDKTIESLQRMKLAQLNCLPKLHSVWGNVDNPMSWRLITKVDDGVIKFKGFITQTNNMLSYVNWQAVVNSHQMVDITALVRTR